MLKVVAMDADAGELHKMSRRQRLFTITGMIGGAVVAGVATFLVFAIGASMMDVAYEKPILFTATVIGMIHGAIVGPLIAYRFLKGRKRPRTAVHQLRPNP